MNLSIWVGTLGAIGLMAWGITQAGSGTTLFDLHGAVVVVGGTIAVMMINCSFSQILSALTRLFALFLPSPLPTPEAAIEEVVRLSRKAQKEGGLLSIQEDSAEFAGGFLRRAIVVAIATGESNEIRRIMESEIRQTRVTRQEDANVFRTMGVLAPMLGLLGTLLGMIRVLGTLSDPTKVGTAMALALSSAFLGIGIANFICVPVAGQIRLLSLRETMILEILLEGVLDIATGKAPYLVELHLAAYSKEQRQINSEAAAGVQPTSARSVQ